MEKYKLKNLFIKYKINTKIKRNYIKLLLLIININISIININFLIIRNNFSNEKFNKTNLKNLFSKFKNVDRPLINFGIKSYKKIVNLINKNIGGKKKNKKKKIVIHSVDFLNNDENNIFIKRLLKDNFVFEFNNTNPDYLLYDVFGCEHLDKKYNNAIKIAFLSENIIPNFNEADYAISQANINYLDRYFKYPIFIYNLEIIKNKNFNYIRMATLKYKRKRKFCAAVISNNISTDFFRNNFIKELNKYKKVDMGGKVNNNVGGPIEDKIKFLSSYKFSIAMENSEGDGYISEKIIDSILAGTIPIYYGDYYKSKDLYIN